MVATDVRKRRRRLTLRRVLPLLVYENDFDQLQRSLPFSVRMNGGVPSAGSRRAGYHHQLKPSRSELDLLACQQGIGSANTSPMVVPLLQVGGIHANSTADFASKS